MLFNANIILEILRSSFSKEIKTYMEQCIMGFDEYELANIFETQICFALLRNVGEIIIKDYYVEEEDAVQIVEGTFGIESSLDGFEKNNDGYLWKGITEVLLVMAFSFQADGEAYSDIKLEYKYSQGL